MRRCLFLLLLLWPAGGKAAPTSVLPGYLAEGALWPDQALSQAITGLTRQLGTPGEAVCAHHLYRLLDQQTAVPPAVETLEALAKRATSPLSRMWLYEAIADWQSRADHPEVAQTLARSLRLTQFQVTNPTGALGAGHACRDFSKTADFPYTWGMRETGHWLSGDLLFGYPAQCFVARTQIKGPGTLVMTYPDHDTTYRLTVDDQLAARRLPSDAAHPQWIMLDLPDEKVYTLKVQGRLSDRFRLYFWDRSGNPVARAFAPEDQPQQAPGKFAVKDALEALAGVSDFYKLYVQAYVLGDVSGVMYALDQKKQWTAQEAQLYVHAVHKNHRYSGAIKKGMRSKATARALALHPEHRQGPLYQAFVLMSEDQPLQAWQRLTGLLQKDQNNVMILYSLHELARTQGWTQKQEHLRAQLAPLDHPDVCRLIWEHARKVRTPEALEKAFIKAGGMLPDAAYRRARDLTSLHQFEKAERMFSGLFPPQVIRDRGTFLRDMRRYVTTVHARGLAHYAAQLLERQLAAYPRAYELHLWQGDMYMSQDKQQEALAAYERSFALHPADEGLYHRIEALKGIDPHFEKPFMPDLKKVLAREPRRRSDQNQPLICLYDLGVTKVLSDGSQLDVVYQVHRINNHHGVKQLDQVTRLGEVQELYVWNKDSGKLLPILIPGQRNFTMPDLKPGSVVVRKFRSFRPAPMPGRFFSYRFYFQDYQFYEPFLVSEFVVILDKKLPVKAIMENTGRAAMARADGTFEHKKIDAGKYWVYTWHAEEMKRVPKEEDMQAPSEFLPSVYMGTPLSLYEIIAPYLERYVPLTWPGPWVAAKAKALTQDKDTSTAKAKALYDYVQEHIHFQDEKFKSAPQILHSKRGNPLTLFTALTRAAGLPVALTLALPSEKMAERPRNKLWHPYDFRQAGWLLQLETQDQETLYFDFGRRYMPFGLTDKKFGEGQAITLNFSGVTRRVTLPKEPAHVDETLGITGALNKAGGVTGTFEAVWKGPHGAQMKEMCSGFVTHQWNRLAESLLAGGFPGVQVTRTAIQGQQTLGDMRVSGDFVQGELVSKEGMSLPLALSQMSSRFVKLKASFRRTTYHQKQWLSQTEKVTLDLGDHWQLEKLPKPVKLRHKNGQYELAFELKGTQLIIFRSKSIFPGRITPVEFFDWKTFCEAIDAAEKVKLYMQPKEHKHK